MGKYVITDPQREKLLVKHMKMLIQRQRIMQRMD